MKSASKHPYSVLVIIVLMFSSCAQLTVFHTARTEGKGNITITPGVEGIGLLPNGSASGDVGAGLLPVGKLELSYGLTEHLDVIASASTSLSLLTSLKYQMVGDNQSAFSLALMPGYEFQASPNGGANSIYRLHLPLIATFYTAENTGFYISPKYALQVEENNDNFSFPGFSAGVVLERNIKYIIGGGVFLPFNTLTGSQGYIYQFGINARIPLYRNN